MSDSTVKLREWVPPSSCAPPDVIGAVITWLAKNPKEFPNGAVVAAQKECAERGLLPGWPKDEK